MRTCDLHRFGCGNSLVINQDDYGVGMQLRLRIMAPHELACYTINEDGINGCRVCFVAWEVSAVGDANRLDGAIVCIGTVFKSDHENRSMRHLFHQKRGYAYARIVEFQKTNV